MEEIAKWGTGRDLTRFCALFTDTVCLGFWSPAGFRLGVFCAYSVLTCISLAVPMAVNYDTRTYPLIS